MSVELEEAQLERLEVVSVRFQGQDMWQFEVKRELAGEYPGPAARRPGRSGSSWWYSASAVLQNCNTLYEQVDRTSGSV